MYLFLKFEYWHEHGFVRDVNDINVVFGVNYFLPSVKFKISGLRYFYQTCFIPLATVPLLLNLLSVHVSAGVI